MWQQGYQKQNCDLPQMGHLSLLDLEILTSLKIAMGGRE